MKQCPTCKRVYTDESLSFCLDDGTMLAEPAAQDQNATLVISPENMQTLQERARAAATDPIPPTPTSYPSPRQQATQPAQPVSSWNQPSAYAAAEPKKRSALPWIIGGLVVVTLGAVGVILVVFVIAAVNSDNTNNSNKGIVVTKGNNNNSGNTKPTPSSAGMKTINSADGYSQIDIPNAWGQVTDLVENGTIQASYPAENAWLVVFTIEKSTLPSTTTLDEFASSHLETIAGTLKNAKKSDATPVTINGMPGHYYEIHGDLKDDTAIVYSYTVLEASKRFHQIVVWTLEADFKDRRETMVNVAESFREK